MNAPHLSEVRAERAELKSVDYLDLETPIREAALMAGIAHDLAYELLDVETPKNDEVLVRMSKRQYEQLWFAIEKVHYMTVELEKIYHHKA